MSFLSASDSNTKIMNAALALIGANAITSFLDDSLEARTGNALFEDTLENALSMYPWRFAQRTVLLSRLSETPHDPWEGFYQIPGGMRVVRRVLVGTSTVHSDAEFDVFERRVAVKVASTSTELVYAVGTYMVDPGQWPGYFRLPFIQFLASVICVPITQDEDRADMLQRDAQNGFARGASRDSQGRTPQRLDTKSFIRARRSGGRVS